MELFSGHCIVSSVDEDDDEDAVEAAEVRGTTGSRAESLKQQQHHDTGLSANQQPPLSPVQNAGVQLSAPPSQRPSEAPPTTTAQTKIPAPSASNQTPSPLPLPTASAAPQV